MRLVAHFFCLLCSMKELEWKVLSKRRLPLTSAEHCLMMWAVGKEGHSQALFGFVSLPNLKHSPSGIVQNFSIAVTNFFFFFLTGDAPHFSIQRDCSEQIPYSKYFLFRVSIYSDWILVRCCVLKLYHNFFDLMISKSGKCCRALAKRTNYCPRALSFCHSRRLAPT